MARFKRRYKNSDRTGTVRVPVSPHNLKQQVEHFAKLLDTGYPIECRFTPPNESTRIIVYTQQGIYENNQFIPSQPAIQILDDLEDDSPTDAAEFDEATIGIEDLISDFGSTEAEEDAEECEDESSNQGSAEAEAIAANHSTDEIDPQPSVDLLPTASTRAAVEVQGNQPSEPTAKVLESIAGAIDAINEATEADGSSQLEQDIADEHRHTEVDSGEPEPVAEPADKSIPPIVAAIDRATAPLPAPAIPDSIMRFSQRLFEQWRLLANGSGSAQGTIPWKTPVSVEKLYEQAFGDMSAFIFLNYLDIISASELNPQYRLILVRSTANQSYIEFLTFSTASAAAVSARVPTATSPIPAIVPAEPVAPDETLAQPTQPMQHEVTAEAQPAPAFVEPHPPIPSVDFPYLDRLRSLAAHNSQFKAETEAESDQQPESVTASTAQNRWGLFKRNR